MGDVQTYFYLALISVIMIGLILLFVFIAARGAITVALLFIVLGTAGVLYGFIRYGAS